MKFVNEFKGVPNGEIYPVDYQPGDECPDELLASAIELGAVETDGTDQAKPKKK